MVPGMSVESAMRRARELGDDAAMLARMTRDLPGYLRTTLTLDEVRALLRHRMATREQRLMTVVERAIYGSDRSPYRALLRHAGCELGDFRALVSREGIEGALTILAGQGVYVTFDEFKGQAEAVRGSRRFRFERQEFDNPLIRPHGVRYTGGSGGRPSRVGYTLPFLDEWAIEIGALLESHGLRRPRQAYWWPIPLIWMIVAARLGHRPIAWFYPVHPLPWVARLAASHAALVARLAGRRFPLPERCDLDQPGQMVGWIARQLRSPEPLVLWTMPSAGARLGVAAREAGVDLRGLTLMVAGEPVTDARRRPMEEAGAQVIVWYGNVELSGQSFACAEPTASDDVHVMLDRFAHTVWLRPASPGGPTVESALFTSLSPQAGVIALNFEPGDYTRVEERDCGCLFGEVGMRTHLSEIRSFEKMTGEGVTFARSSLEQILEEQLPAIFGGSSVDYQLVEEETAQGSARLVLRVRPDIGPVDEAALRATLLEAIGKGSPVSRYQAGMWRSAGTIEVVREAPIATRAGKVLPFQMLKRT